MRGLGSDIVVTRVPTAYPGVGYPVTCISPTAPEPVDHPVWSRDGKTLYYTRAVGYRSSGGAVTDEGTWTVFTTDPTGGTCGHQASGIPVGERATSTGVDGTVTLIAQNAHSPYPGTVVYKPGSTTAVTVDSGIDLDARFSPDGTKVAVLTAAGGAAGSPGTTAIRVYDYQDGKIGASPTQVCTLPADHKAQPKLLWSPDGTSLSYATTDFAGNAEVLTVAVTANAVPSRVTVLAKGGIDLVDWHDGPLPVRPEPSSTRLAGADRIGTAVAVADAAYNPAKPGTSAAKVAVLSRSDTFADALPGNALAAQKHGPLLLTGSAKLDPATAHELTTVLPHGAVVYLLGGTQALSPQVEADIKALGLTPERLAGGDRFTTSTAIAAEISAHPSHVLVATGKNYPDALAAGAAAAAYDDRAGVVLLTDDTTMPAATRDYLKGLDPASATVYGVGGQAVRALTSAGLTFTPLSGDDRYATDLAVAQDRSLFPGPTVAGVAVGTNWPDALAGGAYIGALHGPLLLTENDAEHEPAPWNYLAIHRTTLDSLAFFGGTAVISDQVMRSLTGDIQRP